MADALHSHYNFTRRVRGAAAANLNHDAKVNRKHDLLDGAAVSDSSASNSDNDFGMSSPATEGNVVYSFDAVRSPSHGSQILNVALAKAVERFEERETAKLVKNEYDVLDSEGESVGLVGSKKGKGRMKANAAAHMAIPDADEDYEFV